MDQLLYDEDALDSTNEHDYGDCTSPTKADDVHEMLTSYLLSSKTEDFNENSDFTKPATVEDDCISDISDVSEEDICVDDVTEDIEENIGVNDEDNEPLYPGASVSLGAFMLLLAVFCTKHNIIGDGIQQLLSILALILPNGHKLCTSLHSFKMYFRNLQNPLIFHYYCKHCLGYIEDTSQIKCQHGFCQKTFNKKEKTYFLEMPIVSQLRNLFLHNRFFYSLQTRFTRNIPDGTFEDIYDGILYKSKYDNGGPLSFPENISFTFNTDGAPVFKSSSVSIWPIYLVINELPYKLRMKKENMILASLWFGKQKPSMATYLKPLLHSLNELSKGVVCYTPSKGEITCKAFLLCGTADLPARCLLCNNNQYNGAYSCWKCEQRGSSAKVGKGHAHVFPYNRESPKGPERTQTSVLENAQETVASKLAGNKTTNIKGVKGPSWLMLAPEFNIIHGIAIDYMHGVLLGVQKLLLRLWFSAEYVKENFSFKNAVSLVDSRLKSITPTLDITRLPRSIEFEMKHWKASEFRSFLLFYGAIVLNGVLDRDRFCHYMLLVNAMHILLQCGSRESDVKNAESMLFSFCENFAVLYNERYMTLNLHQLLHLADSVRYLGPLYTHSCFSFEDKNGAILKMIKGTQCIDNQIITGVSFIQKLPELKQKCLSQGTVEEKLYNAIDSPHLLKRGAQIHDGIFVLGRVKNRMLMNDEFQGLAEYIGEMPTEDHLLSFNRIEIKDMIIYGLLYKRMSKRDNSAICFHGKSGISFGRVRTFLQIIDSITEQAKSVAVVELLECPNYNNKSNIISVTLTRNIEIVPVTNIKSSCMFINIDQSKRNGYVCLFPNRQECD